MKTFNKWWVVFVVSALLGMISFFQVNSWWADQHHFNGWFLGWKGVGAIFSIIALFSIYKVWRNAGGNTGFK